MSRRVVRLSRVDRERLERGEIAYPEQALHRDDHAADPLPPERRAEVPRSGRDAEILSERPPHYGS
ncbi:MAG: hypothetical protein Q4P33_06245 [Flaviflexus sp.]|nr:hypothetical protein [Flaviflexus sp.]